MKRNGLSLFLTAVLAIVASGCQNIDSTFTFDERVLVKVPSLPGEPVEMTSADGYRFKPIVAATATSRLQPLPAEWYMVWQPGQKKSDLSLKRGMGTAWEEVRHLTPKLADETYQVFGCYPMVIEPNVIFGHKDMNTNMLKSTPTVAKPDQVPIVRVREGPSTVWPSSRVDGKYDPFWHLGDQYSQLRLAREKVEAATPGMDWKIKIGILDCGFDGSHVTTPERVDEDPLGDAINVLDNPGYTNEVAPGEIGASHGTGTIGLLAGRKVRFVASQGGVDVLTNEDYMGGDPHATIVPAVVSPWVVSLETADLAYGIDYASRVKKCDVISMSNGGAPCLIWVDAVNAAYERGTAIFAACGDFYHLIGTDLGFIVPSSTVYPAAFRRVIGVTGVTANGTSSAKNPFWRLLIHPLQGLSWFFRGSYGADMQSRWLFGSMDRPDGAQVKDNGILHAYPISAYTPNTVWPVTSLDSQTNDLVDLNGAGTSAATPQVAAAAALWLRMNYDEINARKEWNTWKKTEAVYVALLATAQREKANQPDHYLGAGILKAANALTNNYDTICKWMQAEAEGQENPLLKYAVAPRDYFDGQRSEAQLLMPWRHQPSYEDRADLWQTPADVATRQKALETIYYNGLLLEQFQQANTPRKGPEADGLIKKAKKMAAEAGGDGS